MKIGKIKAKLLKTVVNSAKAIVDEAAFQFDENGLLANCMDQSHSCMVMVSLEPEAFTNFEMKEVEKVGVELSKLANGLSVMDDDDDVHLSLEKGKFILKCQGVRLACQKIDTATMEEPRIPTLPWDQMCSMVVDGGELQKAIKVLSKVGADLLRFNYTPGRLELLARDDYDEMTIALPVTEESNSLSAAQSTFDRELMSELVKAFPEGPLIVKLAKDLPIAIIGKFGDETGELEIYQAPRITDTDEDAE